MDCGIEFGPKKTKMQKNAKQDANELQKPRQSPKKPKQIAKEQKKARKNQTKPKKAKQKKKQTLT